MIGKWLKVLALACAAAFATSDPGSALELTPAQAEGPYYPRNKPADTDADLTRIGNGPAAKGHVLAIEARVVDPDGKPIDGARVEIWQTDAQGIYMHPDDPRSRRRDPNFQSYGEARTDTHGRARFTTIRPPPYEGRPAHIHVKVIPPGGRTLTTQLYFAGDPGLGRDGIARRLGKALDQVTLSPAASADGRLEAAITLVVRRGR
jgi:protocatechuate 3,4-dioxygenase beta subunit